MSKSPAELADSMIANMPGKTGKSLAAWIKIVRTTTLGKHRDIVNFLKQKHDVSHGFANLIANKVLEASTEPSTENDLVDAQYSGGKSELRSIYDSLIKAVCKFGCDVEISPKKNYVSLRRSKQFAIIQPSTKTRIDIGINCKGQPTTTRLEAAGSFNGMVSHRVRVTDRKQVDEELLGWLQKAYLGA